MLTTEMVPFTGIPADIPAINELAIRDQWVAWKYSFDQNGKPTKIPVCARSGFNASHSDQKTWCSFNEAVQFALNRKLAGVGYVLTDDDEYTGIDLDKCIDEDGLIEPWAQEIIDLAETYAEYSPSGHGIRMFIKGKIDRSIGSNKSRVEMYRASRYLTITGKHAHGTPNVVREAPETLRRLLARVSEFRAPADYSFNPASLPNHTHLTTSLDEIKDLLSEIDPDCPYDDWLKAMMAVHGMTNGSAAGFAMVNNWSAGGSKYSGVREIENKWRSFKGHGVGAGTLATISKTYGADLSEIARRHNSYPEFDAEEAARISAMILAAWEKQEREKSGTRQVLEQEDGTLTDAETGEVIEQSVNVPAKIEQPISYPPGLVGSIAQWIVATARRPQPELAIGAALAIVGTVAGRQFAGPTRSGTHLYVLGLAPTGKGKDHPLQQISRIMAAAKLSHHVGPSEFISMPAVVKFLMRKPLSICPMDEFGGFMKRINSRRASGFESSISKILRTMWSSSFAPYMTPEWASTPSEIIHSPSITIFGASTPEQFYSSMEGASLEDGTLNRFLLVNGRASVSECDPAVDPSVVPDSIVDGLRRIYFRSGELASGHRNDPSADPSTSNQLLVLPWCVDGAHAAYTGFSKEIERLVDKDIDASAFYARTVEMALRIATIVAIGRLEDEQIRRGDVEYGIEVSYRSGKFMAEGAADYMADNENQANAQKIMRAIKARNGRASQRTIMQSLKNSIRPRDLREILQAMCDAGQLTRWEVKPPTGPSMFWYQIE